MTVDETREKSEDKIAENDICLEEKESQLSGQSGIDFLISIAGIFDSGATDTSENAESIVTDFILKKHRKTRNGSAN
ncbi:MAG: hypothetical protein HY326_05320 [Chloroflexi bacterium]|nr:hypothetical protein [Chloroflexota bacterium]